jgi:hypothetical protein
MVSPALAGGAWCVAHAVVAVEPLAFNLTEMYEADRAAREAWPVIWWALEPFDQNCSDRHIRYCGVFRKPVKAATSSS